MKTKQLITMGLFGLFGLGSQAQNVQSNTLGTSGGSGAQASVSPYIENTFYGYKSGAAGLSANNTQNCLFGHITGSGGGNNVYVGAFAGTATTTAGNDNTCVGSNAFNSAGGHRTVAIGSMAGESAGGNESVMVGLKAGSKRPGNRNVFIGTQAGGVPSTAAASNNSVCIGYQAGYTNSVITDKLFIDNSSTATPLIWGDFANDQVKLNGKVGIGAVTTFPTNPSYSAYKLFVTGGILSDEVRVNLGAGGTWPDYVFAEGYALPSLTEVEKYILKNKHLESIPSATEVAENGIELKQMTILQQQKIEELTLYIIEQNKINDKQATQIEKLQQQVEALLAK